MENVQRTEKDLWVEMSIREISSQCNFAKIAFSNIDPKATANDGALFSSIHSFLSHCTMISKMLKSEDDTTPAKSIGEVLGVPESSIIHQRTFRNHLEHYDERLKSWIRKYGPNANIGTYNRGPKQMIAIPDMVFVSHYDPQTRVFTFVNEDFELTPMFEEVEEIQKKADDWVQKVQIQTITAPYI